jgi:hypothetical protein
MSRFTASKTGPLAYCSFPTRFYPGLSTAGLYSFLVTPRRDLTVYPLTLRVRLAVKLTQPLRCCDHLTSHLSLSLRTVSCYVSLFTTSKAGPLVATCPVLARLYPGLSASGLCSRGDLSVYPLSLSVRFACVHRALRSHRSTPLLPGYAFVAHPGS